MKWRWWNLENQEDVDEDEIGDQILRPEFDRALKDLNPKKVVGIGPAEVLSSVGQEAINRLFNLISKLYKTGGLSNFKKRIITFTKKAPAIKYKNFCIIA